MRKLINKGDKIPKTLDEYIKIVEKHPVSDDDIVSFNKAGILRVLKLIKKEIHESK